MDLLIKHFCFFFSHAWFLPWFLHFHFSFLRFFTFQSFDACAFWFYFLHRIFFHGNYTQNHFCWIESFINIFFFVLSFLLLFFEHQLAAVYHHNKTITFNFHFSIQFTDDEKKRIISDKYNSNGKQAIEEILHLRIVAGKKVHCKSEKKHFLSFQWTFLWNDFIHEGHLWVVFFSSKCWTISSKFALCFNFKFVTFNASPLTKNFNP